jgi:hypothetical protein
MPHLLRVGFGAFRIRTSETPGAVASSLLVPHFGLNKLYACGRNERGRTMNRLLVFAVLIGALLVATNPSRAEFNAWAQTYVVKKIEDEARKRGEDPHDGSAQFGGAIAGLFISNMPIERQNLLAFSVYRVRLPEQNGGEKDCKFLGVAGQFLPVGGCDLDQ